MKPSAIVGLLLLALVSSSLSYSMDPRWVQECGGNFELAAPPNAQTPTPLAPGPHPLGSLKPWLECISKSPTTITAYFGFNNPTMEDIGVPVGPNNRFVPDPINRSQTTNFLSGRSRYFPVYAFSVTIGANAQASWQLNGYEVTANANSEVCETSYSAFQMIVDAPPPLPAPSPDQVDALVVEAATQMGTTQEQILTGVQNAGLGKYQIIFNVTTAEDGSGIHPVLGVTTLFGDNVRFSALVDRAIAVGLAPSLVEPLASGKEVEGKSIAGGSPSSPSPSATTPSATPTPSATSSPSSPAPGSSTPSTSPSPSSSPEDSSPQTPTFTPTGAHNPVPTSASSPSFSRPDVGISMLIALLVVIVLYAACY